MSDGSVGGNFDTRVDAGDVSATARGANSCAENQIGSMGKRVCN